MDASRQKRRKLDRHGPRGSVAQGAGQSHLIDFQAVSSTLISTTSTFVLQTDELLREIEPGPNIARLKDGIELYDRLKGLIEKIQPHEPITMTDATQRMFKLHRIVIPFPHPQPGANAPYKLAYAKPVCDVVGSFFSGTMTATQSDLAIDLVAEMPASLFQDKDHLDFRYFYRRAYFLACLASGLRDGLGPGTTLAFESLNDNPLLPVLVLHLPPNPPPAASSEVASPRGPSPPPATSATPAARQLAIRVIPYVSEDLLRKPKLLPSRCNIRSSVVGPETNGQEQDRRIPTPFYNSTLKAEETMMTHVRILRKLSGDRTRCAAFSKACVLGRVWLRQRGFSSSVLDGGFGYFEWSVVTALLLNSSLSPLLSYTELFKAVVQFLASAPFAKKPFVLAETGSSAKSAKGAEPFRESGPVLLDRATELNLMYKMSPWSAALLQRYARSSVELLSNPTLNPFGPTLIVNANQPALIFDLSFSVDIAVDEATSADAVHKQLAWHGDLELYRVLTRALGDRAQFVHLSRSRSSTGFAATWNVTSPTPSAAEVRPNVRVGIIFDPAHMPRLLDYGPSVEQRDEAEQFRRFWGEKAELRRFKNGNILECAVWSAKLPEDICEEIVRFALNRHLSISHEHLDFSTSSGLSSMIGLSPLDTAAFDAARAAFQTLEADIRGLEGMPLQVRTLSPASEALRYASIKTPATSHNATPFTHPATPMDVIMTFEASSRWPENLGAIQFVKIEFLLDIARRLSSVHNAPLTYLGRDDGAADLNTDSDHRSVDQSIRNLGYLDVVYPDSATFRIRVLHELESTLLDRQIKNKTVDSIDRAGAEAALASFRWRDTLLPLHSQLIATQCTRLPALSPAIRLVKYWFDQHMLASHVSPELVELLVLHVFTKPHPWTTPSSPATGLLRTLYFLSRWDWRDEALAILPADNSEDAPTPAVPLAAQRTLHEWRQRDPHMNRVVLVVATPHDPSAVAYTRRGPTRIAATRMTRLAAASCTMLRADGVGVALKRLFAPSLQDYDVLIYLSAHAHATVPSLRASRFKNLAAGRGIAAVHSTPPLPRQPVAVLLAELRRVYADALVLFHATPGAATVIGAVWAALPVRRQFRIGLPYNLVRAPATTTGAADAGDDADAVMVNRRAILAEIARIGGDLVERIEVQR